MTKQAGLVGDHGVVVSRAGEPGLRVDLDVTEVPEHAAWGRRAKPLIEEWTPRIHNLLLSSGAKLPASIAPKIGKTDKGIAATPGARIVVSSQWIDKHPDDIGLVLHELVHVIQAYPPGGPGWVTEGVADYLRWGIFGGEGVVVVSSAGSPPGVSPQLPGRRRVPALA